LKAAFSWQSLRSSEAASPPPNLLSTAFFKKHGYQIVANVKFNKYGTVKDFGGIILVKKVK
jgi:hypothetical protein